MPSQAMEKQKRATKKAKKKKTKGQGEAREQRPPSNRGKADCRAEGGEEARCTEATKRERHSKTKGSCWQHEGEEAQACRKPQETGTLRSEPVEDLGLTGMPRWEEERVERRKARVKQATRAQRASAGA